MPHPPTPGVDWTAIHAAWLDGKQSLAPLARSYGISPQAIRKRAKRDGWPARPKLERWKAPVAETPTAQAITAPKTRRDRQLAAFGARSPENAQRILDFLSRGVSEATACKAVGLHRDSLLRWKKDDPEFASLVIIARHEALARKEQRLDEAGERGEWRADLAVLERSPETRADWSDRGGHGSGGGVHIQLNIERGTHTMPEPLDITPQEN